jgi:hypothetical protein
MISRRHQLKTSGICGACRRGAYVLALAIVSLAATNPATGSSQKTGAASSSTADRLGLTCTQILQMNSVDWVAKFNKQKGATPEATARAITAYGECYDGRTDRLSASLVRKHATPPKNARTNFAGFEGALKEFVLKAIADAQPPPAATKAAYIVLYEKQFRYEFYRSYAEKNTNPALTPEESDQYSKAKNRFGELLGLLPEDKAHEMHEAFGEIVGTHEVSLPMKLALYRYAIFILEPPSEKPFAPPPF